MNGSILDSKVNMSKLTLKHKVQSPKCAKSSVVHFKPLFTCPSAMYQLASDHQGFANYLVVRPDLKDLFLWHSFHFVMIHILLLKAPKCSVSHKGSVYPDEPI